MSIEVTEIGGGRYKIAGTVPAADVDARYDREMKAMANDVVVKGFRRGKVPPALLERRYAKAARKEIGAQLYEENFRTALKEKDIRALGEVVVDAETLAAERGKDFSFSVEIDVLPKFTLPDYAKIQIDADTEVTDSKVEEHIELWKKMLSSAQSSAEPTKLGDALYIKGTAFIPENDDRDFDGWQVRLPDDEEEEEVFIFPKINAPVKELLGLKVGDEKTLTLTVNENDVKPEWNGKTATIKFTVKEVHTYVPLSLEELITRYQVKDETELREKMRRRLESETRMNDLEKQAKQVMSQLSSQCEFSVPEKFLAQHVEHILKERLANKDPEDDENEIREEAEEDAEKRAREVIIGMTLADHEKIQVTEKDFEAYVETVAHNYRVPPEQVIRRLQDRYFAANVAQTIATGNALAAVVNKIKNPQSADEDDANAAKIDDEEKK